MASVGFIGDTSAALRTSAGLLALALVLSALCIGALHTPVLCGIAVIVAVAAFFSWSPAQRHRSSIEAKAILVLGTCLTLYTALQALPLPFGVVRHLSPAAADVWAGVLSPLRQAGPSWVTLSLDPVATRIQILRGVVYVASFAVALRLVSARGGTRFLSIVLVATALTMAVSAVLHPALGARRVFGLYAPEEAINPRHIAPLLNPNHLAAYLNIGYFAALGLAFDRRSPQTKVFGTSGAVLLLAVQVWVSSRGGLGATALGSVSFFALIFFAGRPELRRAELRAILPGLIVTASILTLVLGSSEDAVTELADRNVSKVSMAVSALQLIHRYPFFGVGRGAFEVAFPSLGQNLGYVDYRYPENILVEWLTEWGAPVAIAGFLGLAGALRPKARVLRNSKVLGAWTALATTAVHNLVDFNSEVPAIGIAASVCAAIVVGGAAKPRRDEGGSSTTPQRAALAVMALATALLVVLTLKGWPTELDEERTVLYNRATQDSPAEFSSAIRHSMLRHPAEAYLPFIGSVLAARRRESVLPWVERTLTLSPTYGPAHYLLAEQLEATAPGQARLEYRLALEYGSHGNEFNQDVLPRATRLVAGFDDALEVAPESPRLRALVLAQLAAAVRLRLPATSLRLDSILVRTAPDFQQPHWRAVEDALVDVAQGDASPWCTDRAGCVAAGLAAAQELVTREHGQCQPLGALAKLRVVAGDTPALRDLRDAAQNARDPTYCWQVLGELAVASKDEALVKVAEEAMSPGSCSTDDECAEHFVWVAHLEEGRGNAGAALAAYRKASEKSPDRPDITEHTAALASKLGLHMLAIDAYRRLAQSTSDSGKWATLADREQLLLLRQRTP